jgi:hypothetical protein
MKARKPKYLSITQAQPEKDYRLCLSFNDGVERVVDFGPFLRAARHPDLTKYRHPARFKQFRLHHGNVMWGDYEMLFPVADLHEGTI